MKIRVVLTEDNNFLADSLIEKLQIFASEIEFCYRAINGKDLLRKLENNSDVDVILMDIEMPVMDGITAASNVSKQYPDIKITMLTVFDDDDKIFNAILSGANGYMLKDESPENIVNGIKLIMEGGAPMTASIAGKILGIIRKISEDKNYQPHEDYDLSKREIEILEQLKAGYEYKQIGDNLFISPATVRKHIENIYRKLQVNNKVQAITKAMDNKII